jgi:hypothetical protein
VVATLSGHAGDAHARRRVLNSSRGLHAVRSLALCTVIALVAMLSSGCQPPPQPRSVDPVKVRVQPVVPVKTLDPLLEDVQERTFRFFWETAEPETGLVPDRWPKPPFSSIAAVGFALNAYAIGVERGYVTRAAARERTLTTLRFLVEAQQDMSPDQATGYQGFFYHFVNFTTGKRYGDSELSTVDTALLIGGVLFAGGYFDQDHPEEKEIRRIADELYKRVNWPWAIQLNPDIRMAWSPELQFGGHDWRGYNEAMLVFILALGSPTYPTSQDSWHAWTSDYYQYWGTLEGQTHLTFGPMFGHQYTHVWVDLRGIKDEFMWPLNMDYFENSRRAVLAQRAYAIRNPMDWKGYGPNIWGITASDGPGDHALPYLGQTRHFYSYAARGVGLTDVVDDGTIAPTAALGSLPFAPEVVLPAVKEMHKRYGRHIYGKYGFVDAFNPSFDYDVPLRHGKRVRGAGWVSDEYLGIDQGPIISMIENYRSELIWTVMKRNEYLRTGLKRAGFEGGWLE